jgi:hypothetical protein
MMVVTQVPGDLVAVRQKENLPVEGHYFYQKDKIRGAALLKKSV